MADAAKATLKETLPGLFELGCYGAVSLPRSGAEFIEAEYRRYDWETKLVFRRFLSFWEVRIAIMARGPDGTESCLWSAEADATAMTLWQRLAEIGSKQARAARDALGAEARRWLAK